MPSADAPETNNAADPDTRPARRHGSFAARASAPTGGRDREAGAGGGAAAIEGWRPATKRVVFTGQDRFFGASAQAGARLDALIEEVLSQRNWRWLCTGTFKRKMFGDPVQAIRLLRRNLNRHFRGRDWFACAEQHADGSWHVHFILDETTPRSAVERFAFWWGFDNRLLRLHGDAFRAALNIGRADIREVRNRDAGEEVKRVCVYVCKYLVKQRRGDLPGKDSLWASSLHHGDRRAAAAAAASAKWHAALAASAKRASSEKTLATGSGCDTIGGSTHVDTPGAVEESAGKAAPRQ